MRLRRVGFRIRYYDAFSGVYDRFVAAHSSDRDGRLREVLADRADLRPGDCTLDLCTGTGAMLPALARRAGHRGLVVGLDFSGGMLREARKKIAGTPGVALVRADAEELPFRDGAFHAVTCSHAFYELKGEGAERALREVARTLRPGGSFLMMEHEVPARFLIRILFYVRLLSMGLRKALEVVGHEESFFSRHFALVERIETADVPIDVWVGPSGSRATGDATAVLAAARTVGVAGGSRIEITPVLLGDDTLDALAIQDVLLDVLA